MLPLTACESATLSSSRRNLFPWGDKVQETDRVRRGSVVQRGQESLRAAAEDRVSLASLSNTDRFDPSSVENDSFINNFLPQEIPALTASIVQGVRDLTARGINSFLPCLEVIVTAESAESVASSLLEYNPATPFFPGAFDTDGSAQNPPPATMVTTFPREIKVKELKPFDGTPSDLKSFDNAVKQCLLSQNLPLYYGGFVIGDPDLEYEYVLRAVPNAKSNYIMGKRLCAALTSKLSDSAKKWWEDYDWKSTNAPPNCWRKHADMRGALPEGNGGVVEVAMFDLMRGHFAGDVDARTAEIELGRYKW